MTDVRLARWASAAYERAVSCLTRPIDMAWLAAFRFCFGAVMAISMARFLAYGWIDNFFVNPRFHFKYWRFEWVDALSGPGMYAVFWGLLACATGMALGAFYRLSAALFIVGFAYVQLIDVTNYLNHYYLAWLLAALLFCSPAAEAWSVDAWRKRRGDTARPSAEPPSVALGWLVVFRVQVGVVYTYAGLAKAHADWLIDAQPLRIWLGSRTEMPVLGPLFTIDGMPLLMSWFGFLFDSSIVAFLLWSRTRWLAYVCVLVFHTLTRSLFPIGMFSTIMVLAALVFFPPHWPRALLSHVGGWLPLEHARRLSAALSRWRLQRDVELTRPPRLPERQRRLVFALGVFFCAWQVLFPLRFVVYGGNVRWHEQGMRFSWRVMVREKNGSVTFHVREPQSSRTFTVAPRAYLTRLQEREMSGQPDLILQLAHRIRDDYSAKLGTPVEVRVEALVSLNGRKASPMVDPSVDLAAERDGLGPYRWVLPAPTSRPPHVRPV